MKAKYLKPSIVCVTLHNEPVLAGSTVTLGRGVSTNDMTASDDGNIYGNARGSRFSRWEDEEYEE